MKKIAKGTADYFEKQLHKMLIENFHVTTKVGEEDTKNSYVFKTVAGKVKISLPYVHDYCFCVFGRFKNVDLAKVYMKGDSMFNEHSGKFNFMVGSVPKKDIPAIIEAYKGVLKAMINHLEIVDKKLVKCSITGHTIVKGWKSLEEEGKYFLGDKTLVSYLRKERTDDNTELLDDDYLINEAYELGEIEEFDQ